MTDGVDATDAARTPSAPGLSILIPSYNPGRYFDAAVDSALCQLGDTDEIVIQDGGSTDGSIERLLDRYGSDPRVKVVSESDGGQSDALQRALRRASNPFVGWLNADDLYYPGALRVVRDAIARHPEVDVVYGSATLFDADDKIFRRIVPTQFTLGHFVRHGCHVFSGASFFRAEAIRRAGGFDPDFHYCMDFDLFTRMAASRVATIQVGETLGGLRWHDESKSGSGQVKFITEAWKIRMRYARSLRDRLAVVMYTLVGIAVIVTLPVRHSRLYARVRKVRRYGGR